MMPSVPSEPASMRSGLTPAPEPGRRRDSHAPEGVSARSDSTKSSMCVRTVAKWPAARVAIQPPSVENSNDCGKWRHTRGRQLDRVQLDGLLEIVESEAEVRCQHAGARAKRLGARLLVLVAPAPMLRSPDLHRGECMHTSLRGARAHRSHVCPA